MIHEEKIMVRARPVLAILLCFLMTAPVGILGAGNPARDAGMMKGSGSEMVPLAPGNLTVNGSIEDQLGAAPPKAYVIFLNASDWSYVNHSITFDGNYSVGLEDGHTYIALLVPFSGERVDGWEIHGFFPVARHLTLNGTNITSNFTLTPAYEIILNGTGMDNTTVEADEFTYTRWSTRMDEKVAHAIWSEVENLTGTKVPSVLIPLGETRDLWFQWEVRGFGNAVMMMDDLGDGYFSSVQGGKVVDVNHHLAEAQFSRMNDLFQEYTGQGYTISQGTREHTSRAGNEWESASTSQGLERKGHLNKCIAESILAIEGMELDRAERDLEEHRMGNVSVRVVDSLGRPVEGAGVGYEQTGHDFLFGVFDMAEEAGLDAYRMMRDIGVNYATLGFYWHITEPTDDHIPYDTINQTQRIEELSEMGFELKAHALIYLNDLVTPGYVRDMAFQDLKDEVYDHVYALVTVYKDKVHTWNVINEASSVWASRGLTRAQITELTAEGVRAIEDGDPDGRILVNNGFDWFGQSRAQSFIYEDTESFSLPTYDYMEKLGNDGVDYDIVGQQMYNGGHSSFFEEAGIGPGLDVATFDLGFVSHVFDELHGLDRPIHMTELAVSDTWNESWVDAGYWHHKWDEETQAEFLRQFYTIAFSKEKVEALTWWDMDTEGEFLDGGGFFDENMDPKKNYYALAGLIENWTTAGNLTTNGTGQGDFRGFAGDYNLSVEWKGVTRNLTFHLNETGEREITVRLENQTLRPDLEVNPWDFLVLDEDFEETGEIYLNASFKNVGEIDVSNVSVRFLQGEPGNWTAIGEDQVIPVLPEEGAAQADVTWNATGLFGNITVSAVLDPEDNITELNESNNQVWEPLHLPRPDWGWLDIRVTDNATGEDIQDAWVVIEHSNGTRYLSAKTDDNGTVSANEIPIGCWEVEAEITGYVRGNATVCMDPAETRTVNIGLDRITWGSIRGSVFDATTLTGLKGVTITLPDENRTETTDLGGGFTFMRVPSGEHRVEASRAGYISQNTTVTVVANTSVEAVFHLVKNKGHIEGVVRDNETDEPVEMATLMIPGVSGQLTNEDGEFVFSDIPVGEYLIDVSASGYRESSVRVEVRANVVTTLELFLDPVPVIPDVNGTISGYVVDKKNNEPIARASVTIEGREGAVLTDEEGYFELADIVPGTYTVEVFARGYKGESKDVDVGEEQNLTLNFQMVREGDDGDGPDMEELKGKLIILAAVIGILVLVSLLLYRRIKRAAAEGPGEDDEMGAGEITDEEE